MLMSTRCSVLCLLVFMFGALEHRTVLAQHCAPIVESYLSRVDISRDGDGVNFRIEYAKTGGQTKKAYQAYLLAYRNRDAAKIAGLAPQKVIESGLATVVHTQLAKRNKRGRYSLAWTLDQQPFVEKMLKDSRLQRKETTDIGGWMRFDDEMRIAVFIPFLEDKKYSVIEGLPKKKHECNYGGDSALLFEPLSQRLTVHYGIVQAVRLPEGKYYVQINASRPAKMPKDSETK